MFTWTRLLLRPVKRGPNDMEKIVPEAANGVNTSETSEQKKPQNFSEAPARPDVARPKRGFTKSPTLALTAMAKDPSCPLKLKDLPIVQLAASYAHQLPSGGRGLAFPSKQTLADQLGTCRHTPGRALARAVKSGLCIMYRTRMAKGREDGGQWGTPYYDFAPYYLLCGENVVPRSKAQVKQYLDDAGYWRRGMTLERVGPEAPDGSADSEGHRGTKTLTGEGASPLQGDGGTVEQKSSTNNNSSSDYVKKDRVQPAPKRLSGVDSLPSEQQVVYCRLKKIGYWQIKAISDLKKHGAAYVEARLDFVLRDAKGVNDKAKMVSHWMERPLSEAYAKAKPKPAKTEQEHPQGSEERPQNAPPAPPAAPRPAAAPPEPTKPTTRAEQRDALLKQLAVYDARTIDLGRAHAKGDRDYSESLRAKLDLPLAEMSPVALMALLDHCKTVAAKLKASRAENDS